MVLYRSLFREYQLITHTVYRELQKAGKKTAKSGDSGSKPSKGKGKERAVPHQQDDTTAPKTTMQTNDMDIDIEQNTAKERNEEDEENEEEDGMQDEVEEGDELDGDDERDEIEPEELQDKMTLDDEEMRKDQLRADLSRVANESDGE